MGFYFFLFYYIKSSRFVKVVCFESKIVFYCIKLFCFFDMVVIFFYVFNFFFESGGKCKFLLILYILCYFN